MTDETERMARMEAQMESVREALERIEAAQKTDSARIARLEEMASAGKGSLRTLLWIGGMTGGIAAVVGAVVGIVNLVRHY